MAQGLKTLETRAEKSIKQATTLKELDRVFRMYLGKKGDLALVLKSLGKLKTTERKKQGRAANALKEKIQNMIQEKTRALQSTIYKLQTNERFDITVPGKKLEQGRLHPLTQVQRKAQDIFRSMGFAVADGPEVETEWYNFDALNMPPDHPAREMWDTFWIANPERSQNLLLRTHTSPVQVRYMKEHTPPLRIIVPGRVFRYEATDARHQINFYQLEGLMVGPVRNKVSNGAGKDISVANFRALIEEFYQKFFGKKITVRLRPSYFPFTEPSFEVDMTCVVCAGKGCSSCGHAGFMEMMGAGMVHPNVFKAAGYNPNNWQGFAFGMGLDRFAMMKYKVDDIRLFYNRDLRFLQQF